MNMQIGSSFKYAKFGRGAVSIESRNGLPLDLDQIMASAPAVFAVDKHESRSDRYTFVSTIDMLRGLATEGFHPHSILQGGSKVEGKRAFTKHLVRLRSQVAHRNTEGSAYEVVMLGSHDGTTSTQFYGGFFRFACNNGTIFFDGEATCIKVPHVGDIIPRVIEGAFTVVNGAKNAVEHVDNFKSITLNRDEQRALAAAALPLRFGEEAPLVQPEALLVPRRSEDRRPDLWTTFNVIQESMIRGGLGYVQQAEGRRPVHRSTRPVRSVDGNANLNRGLWVLAEEMAKIKG